ncbi:RepB family protein [Photorhabdus africana]|uniref:RepB family protein n=1 Tax=Photorhabdus africana TaxID=3097554 RepID=UPI002B40964E|nr:RepB family protein [Photorhabdus sp. CRI-LC]
MIAEKETQRKRRPKGAQKSNADTQRDFRERHKLTHSKINVIVPNQVKEDLDFLANVYSKTKTEVLIDLIRTARSNCGFKDPF